LESAFRYFHLGDGWTVHALAIFSSQTVILSIVLRLVLWEEFKAEKYKNPRTWAGIAKSIVYNSATVVVAVSFASFVWSHFLENLSRGLSGIGFDRAADFLQPVSQRLSIALEQIVTFLSHGAALGGPWGQIVKYSELAFLSVSAIAIAPIVEEVVFRGFMYRALKGHIKKDAANVCTAAVFAAVHCSCYAFVPLLVFGVLLGRIYERSADICEVIFVHALFNMVNVIGIVSHAWRN
jgi:membrane protease YdiL (CAAX protease family)